MAAGSRMRFAAGLLLVLSVVGARGADPVGRATDQGGPLTAQRLLENLRTRRYSGRPVDLLVTDARLAVVFAELQKVDGLCFDVDPAVQDLVSYRIRRTPWDEVLALVLSDNNLRIEPDREGTGFKVYRGTRHVLVFNDPAKLGVVLFLSRHLGRIAAAVVVLAAAMLVYVVLRRRGDRPRATEKKALLPPEKAEDTRRRLVGLFEVDQVHLRDDLSLRELAEKLGVTPHQLSWLINDVLGLSFSSLVNGYRVDAAKARLAEPGLNSTSILEVGLDAGFGTKAAFNRAFKRHTGMTPSEFRDARRR